MSISGVFVVRVNIKASRINIQKGIGMERAGELVQQASTHSVIHSKALRWRS